MLEMIVPYMLMYFVGLGLFCLAQMPLYFVLLNEEDTGCRCGCILLLISMLIAIIYTIFFIRYVINNQCEVYNICC